jgi:hypothetical protein
MSLDDLDATRLKLPTSFDQYKNFQAVLPRAAIEGQAIAKRSLGRPGGVTHVLANTDLVQKLDALFESYCGFLIQHE